MIRTFTSLAALLALTACGAPGSPPDGELVDPGGHPGVEADPADDRCTLPAYGDECAMPATETEARAMITLAAYCPYGDLAESVDATGVIQVVCRMPAGDLPVGSFTPGVSVTVGAEDGSLVSCRATASGSGTVSGWVRAVWIAGAPQTVPWVECDDAPCEFIDDAPCGLPF